MIWTTRLTIAVSSTYRFSILRYVPKTPTVSIYIPNLTPFLANSKSNEIRVLDPPLKIVTGAAHEIVSHQVLVCYGGSPPFPQLMLPSSPFLRKRCRVCPSLRAISWFFRVAALLRASTWFAGGFEYRFGISRPCLIGISYLRGASRTSRSYPLQTFPSP